MKSERLVRRVFFGLAVLFVFFIMYASWTPGTNGLTGAPRKTFEIKPLAELFEAHDLRDITTNVLLYLPLGVFLALAVCYRRPRFVTPWLVIGPLVSLVMESGQTFIGRYPDAVDIVTNTTGYILGFWIVVAGVKYFGLNPTVFLGFDPDEEQDAKTQTIAAFRFIYICIYVLIAYLPFDISVSATRIYAQLLPDQMGNVKIILDPLYHLSNWQESGLKLTLELLGLIPVGILTAFLNGVKGRLNVFSSIYPCVLLAVFCELSQVFILSRTSDIAVLFLAVIAGIVGWAVVKIWFNVQNVEAAREHADEGTRWRSLTVALIAYAIVIALFAWSPFHFETDHKTVAKKILYESNAIPFKEHFSTRSLSSAVDIVKEVGIFVPLGVLIAYLLLGILPRLTRWQVVVVTGVICMAYATFVELSQAVCVGRFIDATDVLLAGFGGVCGAVLLRLFRFGPSSGRLAR
jgi:glycopeptide antibiotics resistance protein